MLKYWLQSVAIIKTVDQIVAGQRISWTLSRNELKPTVEPLHQAGVNILSL